MSARSLLIGLWTVALILKERDCIAELTRRVHRKRRRAPAAIVGHECAASVMVDAHMAGAAASCRRLVDQRKLHRRAVNRVARDRSGPLTLEAVHLVRG